MNLIKKKKFEPISPKFVKDEKGKTVAICLTAKAYENVLKTLHEFDKFKKKLLERTRKEKLIGKTTTKKTAKKKS